MSVTVLPRADPGLVQRWRRQIGGRELTLSDDAFRVAVNPAENVRKRDGIGGPAPKSVDLMIALDFS